MNYKLGYSFNSLRHNSLRSYINKYICIYIKYKSQTSAVYIYINTNYDENNHLRMSNAQPSHAKAKPNQTKSTNSIVCVCVFLFKAMRCANFVKAHRKLHIYTHASKPSQYRMCERNINRSHEKKNRTQYERFEYATKRIFGIFIDRNPNRDGNCETECH